MKWKRWISCQTNFKVTSQWIPWMVLAADCNREEKVRDMWKFVLKLHVCSLICNPYATLNELVLFFLLTPNKINGAYIHSTSSIVFFCIEQKNRRKTWIYNRSVFLLLHWYFNLSLVSLENVFQHRKFKWNMSLA